MKHSVTSVTARHGNGSNGHAPAEGFGISRTFTETSRTIVSSVVSTPCRLIDVLEHLDEGRDRGLFTIRETQYGGTSAGSVGVQHIRLYPHELERMYTVLGAILRKRAEEAGDADEPERERKSA